MEWSSLWKKSGDVISDIGKEVLADEDEGVSFFRNRLVQGMMALSVVAFLFGTATTLFLVGKPRIPIVIHYNAFFGVDIFGSWWQAYILPLISFFFFLLNVILARKMYVQKERIASHILLFSAFFVCLFAAIAAYAIARVNS